MIYPFNPFSPAEEVQLLVEDYYSGSGCPDPEYRSDPDYDYFQEEEPEVVVEVEKEVVEEDYDSLPF